MSENTKPTYTITLSNGSVMLMRHLLNQPGWTKNVGDFYIAAQLLAEVIPEPPQTPERPHPIHTANYAEALEKWKADESAWSKGTCSPFTLTEKQRENIKLCLKAGVEKDTAIPSKPAFDLFRTFGVVE